MSLRQLAPNVTTGEAIMSATLRLAGAGVSSAKLDAELLMAYSLNVERETLIAHPEHILKTQDKKTYGELIQKRERRTPLVHLTHSREFYGLDLHIDERVLTPRVETEKMVEWAIELAPARSHVIDIGTGSGAIAIATAKHRPDLNITATDVTDQALSVAKMNAKTHNTALNFLKSNLFDSIPKTAGNRFDVVATNLPYLRDDATLMPEVQYEPEVSLRGGVDGLALYRKFLRQLPRHLTPKGLLLTECDPWQQADLVQEAAAIGLNSIRRDYFVLAFQKSS